MAPDDLAFRYAVQADVPVLVALLERAYRGEAHAGSWASEVDLLKGPRTSAAEVSSLIGDDASRFLLALRGEAVAGCLLIQRKADGVAWFGMFAIDPDRFGSGLGKRLLAEAEVEARALWHCDRMVMNVINRRTVLADWYRRRGYEATGAILPFPFTETSGETTRDFHLVEMGKTLV